MEKKENKYPLFKPEDFTLYMGRYKTLALFWELRGQSSEDCKPILTRKDRAIERDGVYYPSLKEEYLKWEDPTEYDFVTNCLGMDWTHWKRLEKNAIVMEVINSAREELALKLQAKGFKVQKELSEGGNYQASKLLLEKGWKGKEALKKEDKQTRKEAGSVEDATFNAFLQRVK